jgi:hypothetical protein
MNTYNGDQEVFDTMFPLIMSYLNAGGNVFLASRYASSFIYDDLEDYCHIEDWPEEGVNIAPGVTAAVEGLEDMGGGYLSGTDLPAVSDNAEFTTLFTSSAYPDVAVGFVVEKEATGNFAFIAGRPYGYDDDYTVYGDNIEFRVTDYFGEE